MAITIKTVEDLAPDQASLDAASKLIKPGKWVIRGRNRAGDLLWGECQGSGSTPYRVMFHREDESYKCTCPSRKFPCKHTLALMWMSALDNAGFQAGEPPDWVVEWFGRRRKPSSKTEKAEDDRGKASVMAVRVLEEPPAPVDPKETARREKAARTRAEETRSRILDGLLELEGWISDQLRLGLSGFLDNTAERCRRIAARLVDARAASLASRVDEMPARLMRLPTQERLEAVVIELGKLLLLSRSFRADPLAAGLHHAVATAPDRESLLADPETRRVSGKWEVLESRSETQRDGLIRQETWLLLLEPIVSPTEPIFAMLLDFYPATGGKRGPAFTVGDQFPADLAFYPGAGVLRATIVERHASIEQRGDWPRFEIGDALDAYRRWVTAIPYGLETPIVLPKGRLGWNHRREFWWRSEHENDSYPLSGTPPAALLGCDLLQSVAVWNGLKARLIAAQTSIGSCYLS